MHGIKNQNVIKNREDKCKCLINLSLQPLKLSPRATTTALCSRGPQAMLGLQHREVLEEAARLCLPFPSGPLDRIFLRLRDPVGILESRCCTEGKVETVSLGGSEEAEAPNAD